MNDERELLRAKEKAFRLLTARAHSEQELRRKLAGGNFSPAVVEEAIGKCRELGYIDDLDFAKQRARSLATNRLVGNRRIAFDLQQKGVSGELRETALAGIREELDEAERIRRLLRKRATGKESGKSADKEKARLVRNLLGRGFALELIMRILKEEEEIKGNEHDGQ